MTIRSATQAADNRRDRIAIVATHSQPHGRTAPARNTEAILAQTHHEVPDAEVHRVRGLVYPHFAVQRARRLGLTAASAKGEQANAQQDKPHDERWIYKRAQRMHASSSVHDNKRRAPPMHTEQREGTRTHQFESVVARRELDVLHRVAAVHQAALLLPRALVGLGVHCAARQLGIARTTFGRTLLFIDVDHAVR